ncbi:hypothetical protein [Streptomyces boncukensis]|uniref:Uncharacterized protein n=1 Tax=Streptomyces boncukensis TaxID=2711219 RepID=A0A6G4WTB6_9ACTN|nr:hypothetical protein [Streptomyces boncukensis]NGO67867.1 hypothetical protein [Streptomyces boncukensis]
MNGHTKAATRARLLGKLVRGRANGHPRRRALLAAARHLHDTAANFLDAADTEKMPETADASIRAAYRALMRPGTGVPLALLHYVSDPVTGYRTELPELDLIHPTFRYRARELRARHLYVIEMGHLDSHDEDVVLAALGALCDLHREWDQLTEDARDELRRDRTRPVVYRAHDGQRSAEHLRGHLTVLDGVRVIASLDVPEHTAPGDIWQLINQAAA